MKCPTCKGLGELEDNVALEFVRHNVCPSCGKDFTCTCGYSEPPIWMQSRHDFEGESAKLDNVQLFMPELWEKLKTAGCFNNSPKHLQIGVMMYKIPNLTLITNKKTGKKEYAERRVIRLHKAIYDARNHSFTKLKGDREQRASDIRELPAYKSAHRV